MFAWQTICLFIIISFQEAIKASLCGSDVDDSTNDAKPQMESGRTHVGHVDPINMILLLLL